VFIIYVARPYVHMKIKPCNKLYLIIITETEAKINSIPSVAKLTYETTNSCCVAQCSICHHWKHQKRAFAGMVSTDISEVKSTMTYQKWVFHDRSLSKKPMRKSIENNKTRLSLQHHTVALGSSILKLPPWISLPSNNPSII